MAFRERSLYERLM